MFRFLSFTVDLMAVLQMEIVMEDNWCGISGVKSEDLGSTLFQIGLRWLQMNRDCWRSL